MHVYLADGDLDEILEEKEVREAYSASCHDIRHAEGPEDEPRLLSGQRTRWVQVTPRQGQRQGQFQGSHRAVEASDPAQLMWSNRTLGEGVHQPRKERRGY